MQLLILPREVYLYCLLEFLTYAEVAALAAVCKVFYKKFFLSMEDYFNLLCFVPDASTSRRVWREKSGKFIRYVYETLIRRENSGYSEIINLIWTKKEFDKNADKEEIMTLYQSDLSRIVISSAVGFNNEKMLQQCANELKKDNDMCFEYARQLLLFLNLETAKEIIAKMVEIFDQYEYANKILYFSILLYRDEALIRWYLAEYPDKKKYIDRELTTQDLFAAALPQIIQKRHNCIVATLE